MRFRFYILRLLGPGYHHGTCTTDTRAPVARVVSSCCRKVKLGLKRAFCGLCGHAAPQRGGDCWLLRVNYLRESQSPPRGWAVSCKEIQRKCNRRGKEFYETPTDARSNQETLKRRSKQQVTIGLAQDHMAVMERQRGASYCVCCGKTAPDYAEHAEGPTDRRDSSASDQCGQAQID